MSRGGEPTRVAVVGAGSWGTTVAALLATKGIDVSLWARREQLATAINERHENPDYLPRIPLPPSVTATSDSGRCVSDADFVILAVPSHCFREVIGEFGAELSPETVVISLSKGLEQQTLQRMTEVAADLCPEVPPPRIGVLSGPNLAGEIALGQPAASVVAFDDPAVAERTQDLFMTPRFRVYTNEDVIGCELGGVVKNVMAIAAGVVEGLGFGDNTKASLITRGLAEMARLGVSLGGNPLTFSGLAGMGDLIATCTSPRSRNRTVGERLGRGESLDQITGEMRMVAEGVRSTRAVRELAARSGVEMPITAEVAAILYESKPPTEAVHDLLSRKIGGELAGL